MDKKSKISIVYLIAATVAFIYVFIRAFTVDVTYDESWTISDFVSLDFKNIIIFEPCDANNHLLNTLLIKFFFMFGNHSLFVARLPNILAFIVYCYFGYKIVSLYLTPVIGLCCFLLLILNPFALDFFSLARGYGLSLGFMCASLFYLISYIKHYKPAFAFWAIGFGILAVISNFSTLNYWLALFAAINAAAIFNKALSIKKTLFYTLAGAILLALVIVIPVFKLKQNGNLYYGGSNDFYHDTLVSLAKYSFYSTEATPVIIYALNTFLILLAISFVISFMYNRSADSPKILFVFITVICVLSVVLQHLLLGTLYLIDRTALFFYPLLVFTLCFCLNDFSDRWYAKTTAVFVGLAFTLNFIININFNKTVQWYFDAHSSETLSWLNDIGKKRNKVLTLYYSWPFQSSYDYYFKKHKYPFLKPIELTEENKYTPYADFYVYLNKALDKVNYDVNEHQSFLSSKIMVREYPNENTVILSESAIIK